VAHNRTGETVRAALIAIAGAAVAANRSSGDDDVGGTALTKRPQLPRKNAVLVFGATGRTGKLVVKALLDAGRCVIAASRSSQAAAKAWKELGVQNGEQKSGGGILFTETGVDITKASTLKKEIFAGATQARTLMKLAARTSPYGRLRVWSHNHACTNLMPRPEDCGHNCASATRCRPVRHHMPLRRRWSWRLAPCATSRARWTQG
jgi:NmrA-like family